MISKADAELRKAEQLWEEATGPLFAEVRQLERTAIQAEQHRTFDLPKTCLDPELREKLGQHRARMAAVVRARDAARANAAKQDRIAEGAAERIRHAVEAAWDPRFPADTRNLEQQRERCLAESAEARKEAAELDEQIAALEREERAIHTEMCEP